MTDMQASRAMPKYRSHKTVWALKITAIEVNEDGSALLAVAEPGYAPVSVDAAYVAKHLRSDIESKVGGYYVVYRDGYKSWSPEQEFVDGYTLI
jgi:hypothetical protein